MINNQDKKRQRLTNIGNANEISRRTFNGIMSLTVLFGLILDIVIAIFFGEAIQTINPAILIIGFLIVGLLSLLMIYGSRKPVVSFVGFTILSAVFGILLAYVIGLYDFSIVVQAFGATAICVFAFVALGIIFPQFFKSIGKMLFFALLITIIVEVILLLLGISEPSIINWIVVAIFCGYIGYDFAKSQEYVPTVDNAIDSAADIYVDIMNLFVRFMSIFADSKK